MAVRYLWLIKALRPEAVKLLLWWTMNLPWTEQWIYGRLFSAPCLLKYEHEQLLSLKAYIYVFVILVPPKYLNLSWRLMELNYLEVTGFSGRSGVTVTDLFYWPLIQDFCYKNNQKCRIVCISLVKIILIWLKHVQICFTFT